MNETTADKLELLVNTLKDIKAALAEKNPDPPIADLPLSAWARSIESLPAREDPTPEEFE